MTDAPPTIIDEDAAIDSAFFGSHAGRSCYARAHRSGWVLVVRQAVAQREPPMMLRVWGRVERVTCPINEKLAERSGISPRQRKTLDQRCSTACPPGGDGQEAFPGFGCDSGTRRPHDA